MEDPGDKPFLVIALGRLSGITQGISMELQPLIYTSSPNLLAVLTLCLKHLQAPARQSAYAVIW
jgi:transportin-1